MLTRGNLLPTALTRVTPDANFTAREPITQRFPFAAASLSDSVFPTENSREEKPVHSPEKSPPPSFGPAVSKRCKIGLANPLLHRTIVPGFLRF